MKHTIIAYGSIITNTEYRSHENVRVVIVRGFKRFTRKKDDYPYLMRVINPEKAFHALAFDIDDKQLAYIDMIEGHPYFYNREKIKVETIGGETIEGWIYVTTPLVESRLKYSWKEDPDDRWIDHIRCSESVEDFPLLCERINANDSLKCER